MKIEGRVLRDKLGDYPLGTEFKCIGHWDKTAYYREGSIYVLTEEREGGERWRNLVCKGVFDREFPHRKGNGYSGIWQVIGAAFEKELEDYL